MTDLLFELELPEEFTLEANLAYMKRSPHECLYRPDDTGVNRLFIIEGKPLLIRLTAPPESPGKLHVLRLYGDKPGIAAGQELAYLIRDWFDLDRDLVPFYRLAEGDPLLGSLVRDNWGLRIIGIPDLFEAMCWAILGQQVNLAFAYRLKHKVTETFGVSLNYGGETYYAFPRPEEMLEVTALQLQSLQLTKAKASAILDTAARLASGEISRSKLLAYPQPADAGRELMQIRGVGPWTVQYVGMRCLRDPSAFPAGDVGLQNAVKALTGMDRKPTPAELIEMAVRWRGWEAYAVFYLWRALY